MAFLLHGDLYWFIYILIPIKLSTPKSSIARALFDEDDHSSLKFAGRTPKKKYYKYVKNILSMPHQHLTRKTNEVFDFRNIDKKDILLIQGKWHLIIEHRSPWSVSLSNYECSINEIFAVDDLCLCSYNCACLKIV